LRGLEHLGLETAAVASWTDVDEVHLRSPSGRQVSFPLPAGRGTYAAVARRVDLDAALVDVARREGVDVLEGCAFRSVDAAPDRSHIVVHLDGHDVAARFLVAADGMWSPVRRSLGLVGPERLGDWHAFRQYFSGVSDPADTDLVVWFEPDLLPGYAWSFPLGDGRANVGFGIHRGGRISTRAMKALWPDLLDRPHVRQHLGPDARPEAPHRAWPIPAGVEHTVLSGLDGRVLFVGDAAAATDPMTGEGIGQALTTGRWAADAIAAAGALHPTHAAASYRRRVRAELAPDSMLARALGQVLRSSTGTRAAVRVAASSTWTRREFGRWLFEDYPRALLLTPWRWRAGALRGGGAGALAAP
jgi:menaquinone-9 beta-reductase